MVLVIACNFTSSHMTNSICLNNLKYLWYNSRNLQYLHFLNSGVIYAFQALTPLQQK